MSKERRIIFSTPMVQAIIDGRKTQTRRIVKPPPMLSDTVVYYNELLGEWRWINERTDEGGALRCPYGGVGGVLWVREAFHTSPHFKCLYRADYDDDARPPKVVAPGGWKPSIHMPRRLSRIDLEITGLRVERLQDISREDAIAEGLDPTHIDSLGRQQWKVYPHQDGTPGEEVAAYVGRPTTSKPIDSYKSLWLSINGPGSWDANPFVWVIEFKRIEHGR